jgi:hypothetical protein
VRDAGAPRIVHLGSGRVLLEVSYPVEAKEIHVRMLEGGSAAQDSLSEKQKGVH